MKKAFPLIKQTTPEEAENSDKDTDYNSQSCEKESESSTADFKSVAKLYDKLTSKEIGLEELINNSEIKKLWHELDNTKLSLADCRTAQLWLLYLEMVDILKKFISAERTESWESHLSTLYEMLPFLLQLVIIYI